MIELVEVLVVQAGFSLGPSDPRANPRGVKHEPGEPQEADRDDRGENRVGRAHLISPVEDWNHLTPDTVNESGRGFPTHNE